MHEADAEKASGFFHVEALGEVESVVVSIPGEEALIAQFRGESERSLVGSLIFDAEGEVGQRSEKRTASVMP